MENFIVTGVVAVVSIVTIWWLVSLYNALVVLRNRFRNAFSQIDIQLRRRYDLIPNLVDTAKGYMAHERETLTAVTEARNAASRAANALAAAPGDLAASTALNKAESGLAGVLSRLMAVAEQYPQLKADGQMLRIMEELSSTENRIAFARQAYNDSVTEYNIRREMFPTSVVAGCLGFVPAALLDAVESAAHREAPNVSF